jgi:hypothetical protein
LNFSEGLLSRPVAESKRIRPASPNQDQETVRGRLNRFPLGKRSELRYRGAGDMTAHPSPHISSRAAALPGDSLAELCLFAREKDAIDLATGAPGFPATSPALLDAAAVAVRGGADQYEPPAGHAALRRYIVEALSPGADPDTRSPSRPGPPRPCSSRCSPASIRATR